MYTPREYCRVVDDEGSLSGLYSTPYGFNYYDESSGNECLYVWTLESCTLYPVDGSPSVSCIVPEATKPLACAEWERPLEIVCGNTVDDVMSDEIKPVEVEGYRADSNDINDNEHDNPNQNDTSELSAAWMISIVTMGVFAVALIILGVWFMRKRRAIKATFDHPIEEEVEQETVVDLKEETQQIES